MAALGLKQGLTTDSPLLASALVSFENKTRVQETRRKEYWVDFEMTVNPSV